MPRRRALLALLVPLALLLGLVTAAPVAAAETFLIAEMSGDQEVPGPGDDNGFGFAEIRIDPEAGTLCWFVFWEEIADPTAAHIHAGEAGVAGPPVITLDIPDPESETCMDGLDQAALQAVVDDPDAHYVNLHNADFPDGAIRGQVRFPPIPLFAGLSGANEVPGPGDPDASGEAFLNFEVEAGRLCAEYYLNEADAFTAAHVHQGAEGVAGPPVITLPTADEGGYAFECLEGLDPALLQSILDDPGAFYVNVHTADYPDGAARGQLSTEPPAPPPPEECTPPEICGGIMVEGAYRYDGFDLPLSFRTDNVWRSRLFVDGFGLEDPEGIGGLYVFAFSGLVGGGECGYEEQVDIGTGADALIEWLTNHPHLRVVGDVRDVTHAGEPGVQIQLRADLPAECQEGGGYNLIFSPPFDGFYVLQGERVRFIIQEIGEDTVLSIIDDFSGDNMQALLAMLETELDTALWGEVAAGGGGDDDDDDDEEALPDTAAAGVPATSPILLAGWLVGTGVGGLAVATLATRRRHM
jgi:hypothetical protein